MVLLDDSEFTQGTYLLYFLVWNFISRFTHELCFILSIFVQRHHHVAQCCGAGRAGNTKIRFVRVDPFGGTNFSFLVLFIFRCHAQASFVVVRKCCGNCTAQTESISYKQLCYLFLCIFLSLLNSCSGM